MTPERPSIKGFVVKFVLMLLAAATFLVASPALAQGPSGHYDAGFGAEPDTQALAFIRIPLGEPAKKRSEPRIGFGLFTDCSRLSANLSSAQRSACEAQPIRSLEVSRDLYDRDWLISFAGTKRWVGIARWYPDGGFARVGEYGPVLGGPSLQGPPNQTSG